MTNHQASPADVPHPRRPPPQGGRRAKNAAPRPHRIKFLVDDQELASVQAAAQRRGLSLGAYAAMATLACAGNAAKAPAEPSEPMRQLVEAAAVITEQRRRLIIAGNLLNQVARHANSTGVLAPETHRVLRYVTEATRRADDALAELRALTREQATPRR